MHLVYEKWHEILEKVPTTCVNEDPVVARKSMYDTLFHSDVL